MSGILDALLKGFCFPEVDFASKTGHTQDQNKHFYCSD
jgi:hypothetical protein